MSTLAGTPLDKLTPEFLGPEAAEEDLEAYRDAVQAVMQSTDFDRNEEAAGEYVWNDGRIRFNSGACLYCGRAVEDIALVPPVGDDDEWDALSTHHEDDCEWVTTRAHRG